MYGQVELGRYCGNPLFIGEVLQELKNKVATVLFLLFAALFFSSPNAIAHSALVSSYPEAGETLNASPSKVSLTFTDELLAFAKGINEIVVTDSSSKIVSEGDFQIHDNNLTVALSPERMASGTYRVSFRVVSQDGHPIEGSYLFSIRSKGSAKTSESTSPQYEEDLNHMHSNSSLAELLNHHKSHILLSAVVAAAIFIWWILRRNIG